MKRRASSRPSPRRRGDRFRAGKRLWTLAEEARLRREYPTTRTSLLAKRMRRSARAISQRARNLGLHKTPEHVARELRRLGKDLQRAGAPHRYQKGHVPANKGLRRPGWNAGRMRQTWFRKGRPPQESPRYRPVGSLRINRDGVLERKVTDDRRLYPARRWVPVARLVWEAANGPIPPSMRVAFRHGCRTTVESEITPDRLELVTMRELMARNTIHNMPRELASTIQLLGALKRQINRRSRS